MSATRVVLLTESQPPESDRPATGLALRHARMAAALTGKGLEVKCAWPGADDADSKAARRICGSNGFECVALTSPDALTELLAGRDGPVVMILGYWELAGWLPESFAGPVVLDYVAPRLLERQFEDRDRLAADVEALIPVLARCDRVWVGNERQRDLMLPWLLLAGHDCRFELPVSVVPIAGPVSDRVPEPDRDRAGPLMVFHGGRDWPWRASQRWLASLRASGANAAWEIVDCSEEAGLVGEREYQRRLAAADVALEVCDANTERRYSQSFRITDALCAGVPVICNGFLPIAGLIRRYRAGWLVDAPDDLPALIQAIAGDPAERDRRAAGALELARAHLDASRVYGGLAGELAELVEHAASAGTRRLLLERSPGDDDAPGWTAATRRYLSQWIHHRVRQPWQRWLARRMADRPLPDESRACWVVVSRADVFPTDHGAAVKIERTARALSFHVAEVILMSERRDGYWLYRKGEPEYRQFPLLPRLAGWPRSLNLVRIMARGLPYSNAFLYLPWVDRGLQYRLVWLMRRHPVEVVQGEFPAYARPAVWAARLFGTKALMVEHNVEFRRIAEQVPEMTESARRTLKAIEVELANACDRVVTVSNRDRRELIAAGVREALVETIPHGVDLARFEAAEPVDLRARFGIPAGHAVLVYHGIYSYPPNLEAIEELALTLLPRLERVGVPATVVAFGPEPPEKKLTGVVFAGPVDDLAGHLKGGDLAVIPLRQGGGTRMKILDDFAAGVPVVTTPKGMEGIPVVNGRELVIVDDPDEMARAVVDLLDHPARCAELAGRAREFVARLDWREIARRYVELMRS